MSCEMFMKIQSVVFEREFSNKQTIDRQTAKSWVRHNFLGGDNKRKQDAQLSQRDRAAGCVIVFAKSRTLERGDNDLRIL